MAVTILAWGSLIWELKKLQISRPFRSDGPQLPVEFSRISGDGRLTLVIDEKHGAPCVTYTAPSNLPDLRSAMEDLSGREGMGSANGVPNVRGIGFVDLLAKTQSDTAVQRHAASVDKIKAWSLAHRESPVIWTALASNFHEPEKANKPFSVDAAIHYLEALDASTLATALTYIRKAPPEVQTAVRQAANTRWPA